MSNYKIRVNGEAESKEVQGLFVVLGYMVVNNIDCEKGYIVASKNAESPINFDYWHDVKNIITIQELRDLVVLKRNDPKDATHYRSDGKEYFQTSDKERHYHFQDDAWVLSTWMNYQLLPQLQLIEKKEMKEYLRKNSNGTYSYIGPVHTDHVHDLMIEIPVGAVKAYLNNSKTINFVNADDDYMNTATNGEWIDTHRGKHEACGHELIWQRHTNPEELPFIDDEPLQGLNDQYAEIEKVRQTLKTRQDQYGSFEDVAQTTEQLFQVIKGGASFVDFTESQRMALYMIFSKVARLSNGNPNHKDSWHDIAGYATLIDEVL